jgi:hypothetical protein
MRHIGVSLFRSFWVGRVCLHLIVILVWLWLCLWQIARGDSVRLLKSVNMLSDTGTMNAFPYDDYTVCFPVYANVQDPVNKTSLRYKDEEPIITVNFSSSRSLPVSLPSPPFPFNFRLVSYPPPTPLTFLFLCAFLFVCFLLLFLLLAPPFLLDEHIPLPLNAVVVVGRYINLLIAQDKQFVGGFYPFLSHPTVNISAGQAPKLCARFTR